MQRPHRLGALVEHVGALQRSLGIERLPGMDLALPVLDPVEAGFDEVARLQPLLGHAQDGFAGRQSVGRFRHAFFPPRYRRGHDDRAPAENIEGQKGRP